jgi:hypothetical protein
MRTPLSHERRRDQDVVASMPGFGERLSEREIIGMSGYLSRRK